MDGQMDGRGAKLNLSNICIISETLSLEKLAVAKMTFQENSS